MNIFRAAVCAFCFCYSAAFLYAQDWPTWKYDYHRSACAPFELPLPLSLKWSLDLGKPDPAWPKSQYKIRFDASYEPVAAGKLLYVPSMTTDSVTAFDTETGNIRWRFFTEGPVRFAPLYWNGKLYTVSDDGFLYCLNALTGEPLWKFRGGPDGRKILGNDRLINMWPVRGAPVLDEGIIYFAAGIWPFMGVNIHAVNAETGKPIWTNSGTGSMFITQPHESPAFAGIAPQGYCALTDDILFVPGGRTVPAAFDRKTGKLLYYRLGEGKKAGHYKVEISGPLLINGGGRVYRNADGAPLRTYENPNNGFFSPDGIYELSGFDIVKKRLVPELFTESDKNGNIRPSCIFETQWVVSGLHPYPDRICIKAGSQLVGTSQKGDVIVLKTAEQGASAEWAGSVPGIPWSVIAADNKLFIVTAEGGLYCFGRGAGTDRPAAVPAVNTPSRETDTLHDNDEQDVRKLLDGLEQKQGYCIVAGTESFDVVKRIAGYTDYNTIVLSTDSEQADDFRNTMFILGLYGKRISCITVDPENLHLPKYMAVCIISEDMESAARFIRGGILECLRPYGGCFAVFKENSEKALNVLAEKSGVSGLQILGVPGMTLIKRSGPLPGSADWTHQNADAAQTLVSKDRLVKAPLGLLWFGGPPNDNILPRHGHGPSPQVVDGLLYIEGPDLLRAVDIYTGLVVWERKFPGIGLFYDEVWHQAGANEIGSNYVSVSDGIYVVMPSKCVRLDPKTGTTLSEFYLPEDGKGKRPSWGFITVSGDVLAATGFPIAVSPQKRKGSFRPSKQISGGSPLEKEVVYNADYGSGSKQLYVMNRYTGDLLWSRKAEFNFRHNSIACGSGNLFCIDSLTEKRLAFLRRRGAAMDGRPGILCFDLDTGKENWRTDVNKPGTWLAYSEDLDLLIETATRGRDRAWDENMVGIRAYNAADGVMKWRIRNNPGGPVMLHHSTLYMQDYAVDMKDGSQYYITHPVTGEQVPFRLERKYGCNTVIASEYLMTFRSAAAGFYNLENNGGTGNLGGFKSGCTSNLIAAGGILNAPDYTRTCTCSYQNQCSVAAVHMPDTETWTFATADFDTARVKRLGINLGAPGDRLDSSGTYWYEYPVVGGKSPQLPVEITGENLKYVRHHSLYLKETPEHPWVGASSQEGETGIHLHLSPKTDKPSSWTVKLYFCETGGRSAGERVFSVSIQGKILLDNFDIASEAGSVMKGTVKTFQGIQAGDELLIELKKGKAGTPLISGVELIRE